MSWHHHGYFSSMSSHTGHLTANIINKQTQIPQRNAYSWRSRLSNLLLEYRAVILNVNSWNTFCWLIYWSIHVKISSYDKSRTGSVGIRSLVPHFTGPLLIDPQLYCMISLVPHPICPLLIGRPLYCMISLILHFICPLLIGRPLYCVISLVPHPICPLLIGRPLYCMISLVPPSHWSPFHSSLTILYDIIGPPFSLVTYLTGLPSHWSAFSLVQPKYIHPNGPPISLVSHLIGLPSH